MKLGVLAVTFGMAMGAQAVHAQQPNYPPALLDRARSLAATCQAAGGQIGVNTDRPFVHFDVDLTGDGRKEFVLDEAGFGCGGKPGLYSSPAGAAVEIFDGATGASLFRGRAYTMQFLADARPRLMLTLRGGVCSPNALATTVCQRPLTWNAQTRTFAGAPSLTVAQTAPPTSQAMASPMTSGQPGRAPLDPLASVPAPKAGTPAPSAPATAAGKPGALVVTEADKTAALVAARFKKTRRGWERCEDPGSLSYTPGTVEETIDLNNDGRPELVISEGSVACFGNTGQGFTILTKGANGAWTIVMDETGIFSVQKTRANGWLEVMAGGPGFTQPIYRFNGKQYVHNRMVKE